MYSVLVLEEEQNLSDIWCGYLRRNDFKVIAAYDAQKAEKDLLAEVFDVIVLSLSFAQNIGLALADYACCKHLQTQIVFVTKDAFFSDGSIFQLNANARAVLPHHTAPEDLVALVNHCATVQ